MKIVQHALKFSANETLLLLRIGLDTVLWFTAHVWTGEKL
tara:strand:+ start:497 stop:616 length:120 start_codon:yes stop_codon:yes gene_type:complete